MAILAGNLKLPKKTKKLDGGFEYFFFSPLPGEDSHVNDHIFQMGGSTTNQKTFMEMDRQNHLLFGKERDRKRPSSRPANCSI